LKKIVFLIVGALLVLGLVLPGCGGEEVSPYHELVTAGTLTIGVLGDMDYIQGEHALYGAQLAKTDVDTFSVNGTPLTVTIKPVDTNEVDAPGSLAGTTYVASQIPHCDFMVGGFRTEGVSAYLSTIMNGKMVFIDCGAATEELAHQTVDHYSTYKYFFKGTPMNDYLLNHSMTKLNVAVLGIAEAIYEGMHFGYQFGPHMAVLAEEAEWTKVGREMTQASISPAYNISDHVYTVPSLPTSDSQVTTVLQDIYNDDNNVNVVITILSGPAGVIYANTVKDYLPNVLSIGINVEAQRSDFPHDAKYAEGMIFLDGWADGVNITGETPTFVSEFEAAHSGAIPIYTAGTYDAVLTLVKAVQDKAITPGGVVQWLPDDIVSYMEGSIQETAAGVSGVFPNWDGTTTGNVTLYPGKSLTDVPALNETQVKDLWPWLQDAKYSPDAVNVVNWTYDSNDWTMPPLTSHDLCYGTPYPGVAWSTAIASQWQNVSGTLKKVCVWPTTALTYGTGLYTVNDIPTFETYVDLGYVNATTLYGLEHVADLWDQYGWWNFAFNGTGTLNVTAWVTNLPFPLPPP
jgi:hypothetical protein